MQIGSTRNARATASTRAWLGLKPGVVFHAGRATAHPDACPLCSAAPAGARHLAQGLDTLLTDGAPAPAAAPALAAARAFSAGNGFLPGLLVDRVA